MEEDHIILPVLLKGVAYGDMLCAAWAGLVSDIGKLELQESTGKRELVQRELLVRAYHFGPIRLAGTLCCYIVCWEEWWNNHRITSSGKGGSSMRACIVTKYICTCSFCTCQCVFSWCVLMLCCIRRCTGTFADSIKTGTCARHAQ